MTSTIQTILNALPSVSGIADNGVKVWPPFLAGATVAFVAGVLARGIVKNWRVRGDVPADGSDLRSKSAVAGSAPPSPPIDMVRSLERLRSLIRSALAVFTPTTGAGSSIAPDLYERIFNLRLENAVLPENAPSAALKSMKALLHQLGALRTHVLSGAPPADISATLIKLNASARDLVAALSSAPAQTENRAQTQRQ